MIATTLTWWTRTFLPSSFSELLTSGPPPSTSTSTASSSTKSTQESFTRRSFVALAALTLLYPTFKSLSTRRSRTKTRNLVKMSGNPVMRATTKRTMSITSKFVKMENVTNKKRTTLNKKRTMPLKLRMSSSLREIPSTSKRKYSSSNLTSTVTSSAHHLLLRTLSMMS